MGKLEMSEINLDEVLEGTVSGSGSFEELKEAVENGVVSLVTTNGMVVGIHYDSGKSGVEDNIEGLKFAKRFEGHNVMEYVWLIANGLDYVPAGNTAKTALPTTVEIPFEDLDYDFDTKAIAKYLRDTFGHYLSGTAKPAFTANLDVDEEVILVEDIQWGRKK